MKKFDLFIGCFGNGVSVRNKAVSNGGEYEKVCHIAECGKITWYVEPKNIPEEPLQKIKQTAEKYNADFEKMLVGMEEWKRYTYLCDMVNDVVFNHVCSMEGTTTDKIDYLKSVIYQRSTWA